MHYYAYIYYYVGIVRTIAHKTDACSIREYKNGNKC